MAQTDDTPVGLAAFDRTAITRSIEVLVGLLDLIDGNPDEEENGDHEASDGDDGDQAYVEWQTMRGSQKGGPNILAGHEDDEEDDPGEEDDPSGQCDEDGINTNLTAQWASRPGCSISDPDEDDDPAGGNVTDEPHDGCTEDGI